MDIQSVPLIAARRGPRFSSFGSRFRQQERILTDGQEGIDREATTHPSSRSRLYAVPTLWSPRPCSRNSGCAGSAARHGARRGDPRRDQGELVREAALMTMTDPIADMLTRIRNANTRCMTREMPASKLKRSLPTFSSARLHSGFDVSRRPRPRQRPRDQAQVRGRPDAHGSRSAPRLQAGLRIYHRPTGSRASSVDGGPWCRPAKTHDRPRARKRRVREVLCYVCECPALRLRQRDRISREVLVMSRVSPGSIDVPVASP